MPGLDAILAQLALSNTTPQSPDSAMAAQILGSGSPDGGVAPAMLPPETSQPPGLESHGPGPVMQAFSRLGRDPNAPSEATLTPAQPPPAAMAPAAPQTPAVAPPTTVTEAQPLSTADALAAARGSAIHPTGGGGGGTAQGVQQLGMAADDQNAAANMQENIARRRQLEEAGYGQAEIDKIQANEGERNTQLAAMKKYTDAMDAVKLPPIPQRSGFQAVAQVLSFLPGNVGGIFRGVNGMLEQNYQTGLQGSQQAMAEMKLFSDKAAAHKSIFDTLVADGADQRQAYDLSDKIVAAGHSLLGASRDFASGDTEAGVAKLKADAETYKDAAMSTAAYAKTRAETAQANAGAHKTNLEAQQLQQTMGLEQHAQAGMLNLQRGVLFPNLAKAPGGQQQQIALVQQAAKEKRLIPGVGIAEKEITPENAAQLAAVDQFQKAKADLFAHLNSLSGEDRARASQDAATLKLLYPHVLGITGGRPSEGLENFERDIVPTHPADLTTWASRYKAGLDRASQDAEGSLHSSLGVHKFDPDVPMLAPNGMPGKVPHSQVQQALQQGFRPR